MKSYAFLFWAYNVIWIGLALYLGFLFHRVRKTTGELDRLERRLERSSESDQRSNPS